MIKAIKGTKDILPNESPEWIFVENCARKLFDLYDYHEIRTPIFEQTELFVKSIGDSTDIVEKEMYTFNDLGNRSLTLRPEATAPVIRALLEHHLLDNDSLQKAYYIGPMFRQERPQAGRLRQFNQIGVEYIGTLHPSADAEAIILLYEYLSSINLGDAKIKINSVGCSECKKKYSDLLRNQLKPFLNKLCHTCQNRYGRNVFRVLDCKNKDCHEIVLRSPHILDTLCNKCHDHFNEVQFYLKKNNIPFTVEALLVRGLDYYTRTVFEVTHHLLGAKDALAAGGRYDNLISSMGGPDLGAVGFGIGMERTLMARKEHNSAASSCPDVFLVSLNDEALKENFLLLQELRKNDIKAVFDPLLKSIKSQMRKANKSRAAFCIIRGQDELENKTMVLRNMFSSEEKKIQADKIIAKIKTLLPSENKIQIIDHEKTSLKGKNHAKNP